MKDAHTVVRSFFDRYAKALLARDASAIAEMYGVPSLIVSPQQVIAVSDKSQTEEFFASSWGQYDGIDDIDYEISIMEQALGVVWVNVSWVYAGVPRERFCYQLLESNGGYTIVVLTPMEISGESA